MVWSQLLTNPLELQEKQQEQFITLSLIVLLKESFKLPFLKVIYPIIFLFVSWFHRRQNKGKTKQPLFVKEYLTQNQLNNLTKNYMKMIWKKLQLLKLKTKHIQHFSKSLLSCVITIFLKKGLNWKQNIQNIWKVLDN